MIYEDLKALIISDFDKAIDVLEAKKKDKVSEYVDEYKGNRKIAGRNQVGLRQDKSIGKGDKAKTVVVAKIPLQFQKKIVRSAAAFLFGSPVNLTSENEEALNLVKDVWDDNKVDNLLQKFCETVKSETEAVFFFFPQDKEIDGKTKKTVKIRLYNSKNGSYAPTFDEFGDLIAFVWSFSSVNTEGKKQENKWVFTKEYTYKKHKGSDGWVDTEPPAANLFKKIPVVYMSQDEPEWFDVKELIDRFEMNLSKFCDTNDYFSSPIVKLFGKVESMPDKQDQGKAIKIPQEYKDGKLIQSGNAEYLTWDHAPEAIKLEAEISETMIHSLTDTPDLSLNNLMGAGNVASGTAAKFMFMAPILKAKWSEGDYSTAIGRIISLIVQGITEVSVDGKASTFEGFKASVEFTSILPDNIVELISMLSEAAGGMPFISKETAASKSGLVKDAAEEISKINKESSSSLGEVVEP
ncbi:phage portal protein [Flavicella sediminum]|uniref:phage portal protein n=1 Tax=Flavicella sediminum TaxID=2585141 RepID=UPI0011239C2B|nr:phage portal protein [Flavicella sediminum]